MVRLLHLAQRDGDILHDALKARLADLPATLLPSITWDQGTEMARHPTIAQSSVRRSTSATRPPLAARQQRKHCESCDGLTGLVRQAGAGRLSDPRKHWPPVGVPCVGPVPSLADTDRPTRLGLIRWRFPDRSDLGKRMFLPAMSAVRGWHQAAWPICTVALGERPPGRSDYEIPREDTDDHRPSPCLIAGQ